MTSPSAVLQVELLLITPFYIHLPMSRCRCFIFPLPTQITFFQRSDAVFKYLSKDISIARTICIPKTDIDRHRLLTLRFSYDIIHTSHQGSSWESCFPCSLHPYNQQTGFGATPRYFHSYYLFHFDRNPGYCCSMSTGITAVPIRYLSSLTSMLGASLHLISGELCSDMISFPAVCICIV